MAISYPDGPVVGQLAPALGIMNWLQAPPEAAQGWPCGRVVVLEFWSESCGACVASMPHMNALAKKFKKKPVQFVAVTDSDPAGVEVFLRKHPIDAWIGMGRNGGFGEDTPYRVYAIPHVVVIDARGRVAAVTSPRNLTEDMIERCLQGEALAKGADYGLIPGITPEQSAGGSMPLFQAMIRVPATNLPSYRTIRTWAAGQALTLQNQTLTTAIEIAFGVRSARVLAEADLPASRYDFYIRVAQVDAEKQQALFEKTFGQAVEAALGLSVGWEKRGLNILALRTNDQTSGLLAQSTNPSGENVLSPGEISGKERPVAFLREGLEAALGQPVADETGMTNQYNYDVKWTAHQEESQSLQGVRRALAKVGLDLIATNEFVDVVVVRKAL